ncbi:hypothetical protein GmHk_04G011540 [Glycine max]|nr:hypothetical protein GmHk_04G011540 [Glycine max]
MGVALYLEKTRWVPTEGNIAANVMALLRDINRSKEVQKLVLNDDCMYVSDKSGRWKNTNQGFFKLFLGCGYIWRLVELFFATLKANLYKPCLEDLNQIVSQAIQLTDDDDVSSSQFKDLLTGILKPCFFGHIFREANLLPDCFAKHGLSLAYDVCFFNVIPEFAVKFLLEDVNSHFEF